MQASAVADRLPADTRQIQLLKRADGTYTQQMVRAPVPTPGDNQVLLHVRAVSLQRPDLEIPTLLPPEQDFTGQIVGSDAAGDVVRVGRMVKSVSVGQRVVTQFFPRYVDRPFSEAKKEGALGWMSNGVYGDYVLVEETGLVQLPAYLSYEEGAALPSSSVTAWSAVGLGSALHSGQSAVVQGTGGVSLFAIQFAVAAGSDVIVVSGSDEKLQRTLALGAKAGINYRKTPNWSTRVRELTDGRGADLVVDIGGKSTIEEAANSLAYEGTLALVGGVGGFDVGVPIWPVIEKALTVRGVAAGSRTEFVGMCDFMAKRAIRPVIDRRYAFDEFAKGLADIEAGSVMGKVVLEL
jgi:NADPH:quinone reductase-like Zn-dependent oxidoreductase